MIEQKNAQNIIQRVKDGERVSQGDIDRATAILTPHTADEYAPLANATSEVATKYLNIHLKNIGKKLAKGESISVGETKFIQAMADGATASKAKEWAKDQVELGEILSVTRKTIKRWRADGAPCPESDGRLNVVAWRAWMKANAKVGGKNEDIGPSRQQLEAKRLLLMSEKLETEIGILKGEYVRVSDVRDDIRSMAVEVRKIGEAMPASLAPQLAGLGVSEIEKRLRSWWDEYCITLHTGAPPISK
jgi:phage terminase Nu1 subunit (DNA packaging protein)